MTSALAPRFPARTGNTAAPTSERHRAIGDPPANAPYPPTARTGPVAAPGPRTAPPSAADRARDWEEIQERMLVPLHDAVHERLGTGPDDHVLGLGCGSGLGLLLAAGRGARVTGVDRDSPERLDLARERLAPGPGRNVSVQRRPHPGRQGTLVGPLPPGAAVRRPHPLPDPAPDAFSENSAFPYTLVTAFRSGVGRSAEGLVEQLRRALGGTARGGTVVLAGWGPPERCAATVALRVAARLADPLDPDVPGTAGRDDLEEIARRAGLVPTGSGRVQCPFGYADLPSAVRGLCSTSLFDAALRYTDPERIDKELTEALHPYVRPDGTVWLPNVFRYLVTRSA